MCCWTKKTTAAIHEEKYLKVQLHIRFMLSFFAAVKNTSHHPQNTEQRTEGCRDYCRRLQRGKRKGKEEGATWRCDTKRTRIPRHPDTTTARRHHWQRRSEREGIEVKADIGWCFSFAILSRRRESRPKREHNTQQKRENSNNNNKKIQARKKVESSVRKIIKRKKKKRK